MSRSLSYLRRGLLGIAFVGSASFGASQAFAEPKTGPATSARYCPPDHYECCMGCIKHTKRCAC